jgi:Galactose oxidase, central domain
MEIGAILWLMKTTNNFSCTLSLLRLLTLSVVATAAVSVLANKPPGSGTFSLTGGMNVARARQTSTLLNTGEALVAGGVDVNGTPLTSAELYNPALRRWRLTGSMSYRGFVRA